MFRKILLALDGSENAEKAIPWVKRSSGHPVAQVVLFQAVRTQHLSLEELRRHKIEAHDYLMRMEREFNYAGIPAKVVVGTGNAAEAIVDAAVQDKCDLVVMTTRGGAKVERWIVGGVTEQVMRLSPIPVFVVRSRTALPRQGRVRRILVPVDGSRLAESVLPWAEALARFFRATLFLFHTQNEFGHKYEHVHNRLLRRMDLYCKGLKKKGLIARFKVRMADDAAEQILRQAGKGDVIAMTTHGTGGFKRWIFGSVAEKVIHQDRVPVAIYKTPAQVADRNRGTA